MKITRNELRNRIYGQLKNTFNSHPEFIGKDIKLSAICSSATKRIFGDIKKIIPEDDSSSLENGGFTKVE